jgi:hypothetical protein
MACSGVSVICQGMPLASCFPVSRPLRSQSNKTCGVMPTATARSRNVRRRPCVVMFERPLPRSRPGQRRQSRQDARGSGRQRHTIFARPSLARLGASTGPPRPRVLRRSLALGARFCSSGIHAVLVCLDEAEGARGPRPRHARGRGRQAAFGPTFSHCPPPSPYRPEFFSLSTWAADSLSVPRAMCQPNSTFHHTSQGWNNGEHEEIVSWDKSWQLLGLSVSREYWGTAGWGRDVCQP